MNRHDIVSPVGFGLALLFRVNCSLNPTCIDLVAILSNQYPCNTALRSLCKRGEVILFRPLNRTHDLAPTAPHVSCSHIPIINSTAWATMLNIFGNGTGIEARWMPEPGERGTYSILSTCLITLGLCVWTAIHLNIPAHGEKWWQQTWRKFGWMMLGFLAPEMVGAKFGGTSVLGPTILLIACRV